ncbi:MAG: ABC transporter permease [Gammaproteobacteria bacterium]
MKLRHVMAVLRTRNLEFWRDRAALGWNLAFPVLVIAGFAFAFSGKGPDLYQVGVLDGMPGKAQQIAFADTQYVKFVTEPNRKLALSKLSHHELDMLVDFRARTFWVNDSSPRGYLLERVLRGSGGTDFQKQTVTGRQIRYVDWLIPGILALNMMFSALYGVGYVLVRYRKNGVLRRLKATPLTALEFLTAQVISRLWIILAVGIAVYIGTDLLVGFTMRGSYLNLFLVYLVGAVTLTSLGLLVAARPASEEFAEGVLNLITWPMMFLSGVWFSVGALSPWVQKLAVLFPLTHIISAARAVMLDGAGLTTVLPQLLILLVMALVFLLLGALTFRWE